MVDLQDWHKIEADQLFQFAKDGKTEAYAVLYERYAQLIYRFLFARLNDAPSAEQLTEQVFIQLWQGLQTSRVSQEEFLTHLFRTSQKVLNEQHRTKKINPAGRAPNQPIEPQDQAAAALQDLEHQEIRHVLEQLREEYRLVLLLRFVGELTPDQIALTLDRSPEAVTLLQHKALTALQSLLQ